MKRPSKSEIREKYAQFASKYDQWEGVLEWLLIGRLRRALLREARGKVLDVGIGTGKNLGYYPRSCEITGVDYTPAMLTIARGRAKRLERKVNFRVMDAENLKFGKEKFDTVVDTLGLCTYPNPLKALKEMKRVCKRDGQILFLEHGESSNRIIRWLQQKVKKKQLERLGCHVDRDIYGLMDKAGLRVVEKKRAFFGVFFIIRAKTL